MNPAIANELKSNAGADVPNLHPRHFELLRLAKLRGLKVRRIGTTVYAVTSFTRAGFEWAVSEGVCSCPARGFCTHLAAAADHHFVNDASPVEYGRYSGERIADRAALNYRVRTGTLTRNDRTYLRYCVRLAERRMRGRAVKAPGLRRVEAGGRVRDYCGSFQV